jgi:hypothetical protein
MPKMFFVQDFQKLFQNLSQFEYRDRGSFEAWAKKVMVNEMPDVFCGRKHVHP